LRARWSHAGPRSRPRTVCISPGISLSAGPHRPSPPWAALLGHLQSRAAPSALPVLKKSYWFRSIGGHSGDTNVSSAPRCIDRVYRNSDRHGRTPTLPRDKTAWRNLESLVYVDPWMRFIPFVKERVQPCPPVQSGCAEDYTPEPVLQQQILSRGILRPSVTE
jgi:hypothetical protein